MEQFETTGRKELGSEIALDVSIKRNNFLKIGKYEEQKREKQKD